jgi:nitrogen fixation NifU-like protein
MNEELLKLYREAIIEHAAAPVGFQQQIEPTHRAEQYNPLCGDRVEVLLRLEGSTIEQTAFDGEACTICMASASILCEQTTRQTTDAARAMPLLLDRMLNGDESEQAHQALLPLSGVKRYPSRVRCATLPWETLLLALEASPEMPIEES